MRIADLDEGGLDSIHDALPVNAMCLHCTYERGLVNG